eukprot:NODE_1331_length_901_cov_97.552972_g1285_i0.p1 GENE.NODE_1331_length_901_cov_97.552972_g1285_i0~~NODE_1331_length_901_cov_97.552972_g1285_i0.p1  ORF type:complete len:257 (-),score=20.84 NODE_1331_length_901_cov_97.552972_g1285_i0:64-834(-)
MASATEMQRQRSVRTGHGKRWMHQSIPQTQTSDAEGQKLLGEKEALQQQVARLEKEAHETSVLDARIEVLERELDSMRQQRDRDRDLWSERTQRELTDLRHSLEASRSQGRGDCEEDLNALVNLHRRLLASKDEEIRQLSQLASAHKEQVSLLHAFLKDGLGEVDQVLKLDRNQTLALLQDLSSGSPYAGDSSRFHELDSRLAGTQSSSYYRSGTTPIPGINSDSDLELASQLQNTRLIRQQLEEQRNTRTFAGRR